MWNRKWPVTAAIVVLMIVGVFVAAAIARRGADDDARRASDAVQRWYRHHGGAQVRSCEVAADSVPKAPVYACQFVAGGCMHRGLFAIPVVREQIDEHGVAAPLGPAKPKRC
jgi:hypothetical protein